MIGLDSHVANAPGGQPAASSGWSIALINSPSAVCKTAASDTGHHRSPLPQSPTRTTTSIVLSDGSAPIVACSWIAVSSHTRVGPIGTAIPLWVAIPSSIGSRGSTW